jgi:hypothetical protein
MNVFDIIFLVVMHFICDFVLQSRQMAKNKSSSLKWLTVHVITYATGFAILLALMSDFMVIGSMLITFVVINALLHFLTDFSTSRTTSFCYKQMQEQESDSWEHLFWIVIGLDQMFHIVTLILTYWMLT